MKLYKLTNQDGTTYGGYDYAGQSVHTKPRKKNPKLCSIDVFHAYKGINIAFLLNVIHARIENPRLFEIEGDVAVEDFGKVGSFRHKDARELTIPAWVGGEHDVEIRVYFAVLCAEKVVNFQYGEVKRCLLAGDLRGAWELAREAGELTIPAWITPISDNAASAVRTAIEAAEKAAEKAAEAARLVAEARAAKAGATAKARWSAKVAAARATATATATAARVAAWSAVAAKDTAEAAQYGLSIDFSALADEAVNVVLSTKAKK